MTLFCFRKINEIGTSIMSREPYALPAQKMSGHKMARMAMVNRISAGVNGLGADVPLSLRAISGAKTATTRSIAMLPNAIHPMRESIDRSTGASNT